MIEAVNLTKRFDDIVAVDLAYRVFCFHQFHLKRLTFSI